MLDVFLNWFVVAIPFLVTVGATVLALKLPHERHYWKFVIAAIIVGLGFSGITYWQLVRTARQAALDRDAAINTTSERVARETTKNVTEAIGKQYNSLITTLSKQNSDLQGQLSEQSKQLGVIGKSNIVTGKDPLKVEVTNQLPQAAAGEVPLEVHAARLPGPDRPAEGKFSLRLILTTNKVMNGGRVDVTCAATIRNGSASIANAGTMMSSSGMQDDHHTFSANIQSPNWSPDLPLIIDLWSDEPIGRCTITPH